MGRKIMSQNVKASIESAINATIMLATISQAFFIAWHDTPNETMKTMNADNED